jgi:uncharacterized protein YegJ (DUF2314 family)
MNSLNRHLAKLLLLVMALSPLTVLQPSHAQKPSTLVTGGYDEKAMDAAIARARSEVETFKTELAKGDADNYAVKAAVKDGGETEHFWLTDVSFKDGKFSGKINNRPGLVRNVKYGQNWQVAQGEISDWMINREDKIFGGYTIDPLLPTMPKAQAASLRARLVR